MKKFFNISLNQQTKESLLVASIMAMIVTLCVIL
jgi:hypothetical protein